MKNVKILLSAALVFVGATALAQDFSAPQYEKWGDTPEQREKNILNSNFLKESCDNRDYNAAAHYLNELINSVPTASVSFYQRGAVIYKNKINRAKSVAEKNTYIDSLMLMYDLRTKYSETIPSRVPLSFSIRRRASSCATSPTTARVSVKRSVPQSRPAATIPIPKPSWLISATSATTTRTPTR